MLGTMEGKGEGAFKCQIMDNPPHPRVGEQMKFKEILIFP